MKERLGFIGLGIMGKPMCLNLLKAGYAVTVTDINPVPVRALVDAGAVEAKSPGEVARRSDVIITMLPNSKQVREVVLGENGVLEGAVKGSVIIDMSSVLPALSVELAEKAAKYGVDVLDAPVSGGEPKAIDGTLAIMVGGPVAVFEKTKEILKAMGTSVVHIGAAGSGSMTKLANQIIVNLNIAAVSEAFVLAAKAGVDPQKVFEAIRGGLAGSTVLEAKGTMMLDRNFKPGGRIDINLKDISNVMEAAHEIGAPLPLTGMLLEILNALKADGKLGDDHSGIVQYYEKLAGIKVERKSKTK